MAVKVRLMRIGAKGRPFYRVVAVDERRKRTGGYLELLGTYNPLSEPKEINLKQDRINEWVKNGAQLSHGFLRIIGKAPQKPARKPKKDRGNKSSATPARSAPISNETVDSAIPDTAADQAAPAEAEKKATPPEVATTQEEIPTTEKTQQKVESSEAKTATESDLEKVAE